MVESDRKPISKISLAIDGGHNILPDIRGFLGRGFKVGFVKNGGIHARVQNDPLLGSITLYRGEDIPARLVKDHHFGIMGRERAREAQLGGADLQEVVALGMSYCEVVVEVLKGSRYKKPEDLNGRRIATSLPHIALAHLGEHNVAVQIVRYGGKEEGAPRAGIADGVVSNWVSGETARKNGLRRFKEPILKSEAVLVANRQFLEERGGELIVSQFIDRIKFLAQPEIQIDEVIQPTGFRAIIDRARRVIRTIRGVFSDGNKLNEVAALLTPHSPH